MGLDGRLRLAEERGREEELGVGKESPIPGNPADDEPWNKNCF